MYLERSPNSKGVLQTGIGFSGSFIIRFFCGQLPRRDFTVSSGRGSNGKVLHLKPAGVPRVFGRREIHSFDMPLTNFIHRKIDPDQLIPSKIWLANGLLLLLTVFLLVTALTFAMLGEKLALGSNAMGDTFKEIYTVGNALNVRLDQVDKYAQDLKIYVESGDESVLETLQTEAAQILISRSHIDGLILPECHDLLHATEERIDSVLKAGDVAIGLRQHNKREDALAALEKIQVAQFHAYLSDANGAMLRIHADSVNARLNKKIDASHSTVQSTLLPLTALAILIFILAVISMYVSIRQVRIDRLENRQLLADQIGAAEIARNLINIAPVGYHSLDSRGILIDINQTELDWLGYTLEEVVGKKHITDLTDPEFAERIKDYFEIFKKLGQQKNIEVNLLAKDGKIIPAIINAKAIYDSEGNFSHSISMIFNFAERKKLEDDLVGARQEAETANTLKQLFMANMSHEIRTPLNAIIGFSNLLAKLELPVNQREYVENIQVSGRNLLSIVNDILDFEKIRSGMLHIDQVEFDLKSLVHSVITMLQPAAADKHLALYLGTDSGLPAVLIGDPMRLTQILVNLLGNALKFTEKGHVTLRVEAKQGDKSGDWTRVRFEVEDTGIGIPESEHQRIFERFTQASGDTTRKYGGTGLGLALVKMLTELQKGSLDLKSKVGKGSTFIVEIPYRKSKKSTVPASVQPTEQPVSANLSGYHILLVEDNLMNRRIAELYLVELGLKVTQAMNGVEAVDVLRRNPEAIDLILMDIQMPEMDGYQTTRVIRDELGLDSVPIIAMTAHVLAGEREKVLVSGMNDYLSKPIDHVSLVKTLVQFLRFSWDESILSEHVRGNREALIEIAGLFVRQFPESLDIIRQGLEAGDFEAVAAQAHTLRASAAYAGFQNSLGRKLHLLENEARKPKPGLTCMGDIFKGIEMDAGQAMEILKREVLNKF